MDPWRAHRIRRAEKALAVRMLKMISITRKTMEEHKLHLDSFIGTWDEFGKPGGRGLVVITVQEACLWVDEYLEPYLTYFTYF
ncbi:hypothetical protein F2Q69_00032120 [Brassica cretica]|uniref:Uncharacterized protein n=1 Tax=Brassica cretica TaxID=69181 RepID=A0A8S9S9W7_BRACR|nr:hypothetical protein F2Q69_00032120 [Brassica cretica]